MSTPETQLIPPLLPSLVTIDDVLAVELQPGEPLVVTSGDPKASSLELYRDHVVECGLWEVTAGEFAGENTGFGEHMYVLRGEATVTSEDDTTAELRPGVSFIARGVAWTLAGSRDDPQDLRHLENDIKTGATTHHTPSPTSR